MRPLVSRVARMGAIAGLAGCIVGCASAGPVPKAVATGAEATFAALRSRPAELAAFLRAMPKGGDLHLHLSGAVYAERYIEYAVHDGACFDRARLSFVAGPNCDAAAGRPPASQALTDAGLYGEILDALSMRNWNAARISGHDQFFSVFPRFGAVSGAHVGEEVAEVRRQAAADHVSYVEAMVGVGNWEVEPVARKVEWNDDLDALRRALFDAGLQAVIDATAPRLAAALAESDRLMGCGGASAEPGCGVELRFIHEVGRAREPRVVFAETILGLASAERDPNTVGVNFVMPEDAFVPRRDFDLHMRMLDRLHAVYPKARISLHAGELAPGMAPGADLRNHIRSSIEVGHAERIGHGVDVLWEDAPQELLKAMAARGVLVEICLTSNDMILGVSGDRHPFSAYRRYGVPVALATDDYGVARSDMTQEWLRAVLTYDLSYADLVAMARASLTHAFLGGPSIWESESAGRMVSACRASDPGGQPAAACAEFLSQSPRARQQWNLESELRAFGKAATRVP